MNKALLLTLILSIAVFMITSVAAPVIADKDDNPGQAKGCEKANEKSKVREKNPHCDVDFVCIGLVEGTTFESITVPPDTVCILGQLNLVKGDIVVENNAHLLVCPDNEIGGSVLGLDNPSQITLANKFQFGCPEYQRERGLEIGGDVIVNGGSFVLAGDFFSPTVQRVGGNVEITNTINSRISFFNDQGIEGNVSIIGSDQVVVVLSTIIGNLAVVDSNDIDISVNNIGGDLTISGTTGICLERFNTVSGTLDSCP